MGSQSLAPPGADDRPGSSGGGSTGGTTGSATAAGTTIGTSRTSTPSMRSEASALSGVSTGVLSGTSSFTTSKGDTHLHGPASALPTLATDERHEVEQVVRRREADNRILIQKAGAEESLRSFKLLEALRTGEPSVLVPLLQQASSDETFANATRSTPLHLAVKIASSTVVQLVLSHSPPSHVHAVDVRNQTPLHIACALGRGDIVAVLLAQPQVDDSIKDVDGRTCLEVCKGPEVAKMMQVSRAQLSETFLKVLTAYVQSPLTNVVTLAPGANEKAQPPKSGTEGAVGPADQLYKFVEKPRSKAVDLGTREESAGTTLLHEAAKRRDIPLIKIAIARGADVLARDRRNKMPIDVAKDERVKTLLRSAATSEGRALRAQAQNKQADPAASSTTSLASTGPSTVLPGGPVMKGYLSKWTNMARGYHTRWIVLENGYLSYYRDQQEEGKTVRGSISMSVATVYGPESTKNKLHFEVGSKLGKSYPRFYLKGAHPVEVMRWVDALRQAAEQARAQAAKSGGYDGGMVVSREPTIDIDRRSFVSRKLGRKHKSQGSSVSLSGLITSPLSMSSAALGGGNSGSGFDPLLSDASPASAAPSVMAVSMTDDESYLAGGADRMPHEADIDLLAQSIKTHIEMTEHLLASLSLPGTPSLGGQKDLNGEATPSTHKPQHHHSAAGLGNLIGGGHHGGHLSQQKTQRAQEVKSALGQALLDLHGMIDDYVSKIGDRERYQTRRYEKELAAKELWATNMAELAAQQTKMEEELKTVARDSSRRKKQLRTLRQSIIAADTGRPALEDILSPASTGEPTEAEAYRDLNLSPEEQRSRSRAASTASPPPGGTFRAGTLPTVAQESSSDESDGEGDEFFEAIESGAIAPTIEPVLARPSEQEIPDDVRFPKDELARLQEGYEVKRTKLPISSDDRPSVSLWGILKNSIGKDLTKISFPVSFNEPVSMLQRMAEDMEFSECLDAAATNEDSLKRIAYVAAFAMSNYSSTVGRIAKPFNPLLGETFEYVDFDKKYRYMSEQVSHHPPMSACMAESPRWRYFGEVDAKNKFTGKSFEIRPTGVAHAVLRLPPSWAPDYPPDLNKPNERVEEHYTWKKVTTNVSNFILGSPTIDHYGDMEVTNHRTGEKCVLTFKPRGWRGKDANEIKGSVFDKSGNLAWDIAGKWTTQLIARRAGAAGGELAPDVKMPDSSQYLLLWRNNTQPPNMPFNFTLYAVSLNELNERMRVWLPPTDCRLRPDQHAFENGSWDRANDLKGKLEELQRATRRKRESGELPPHKPRWFRAVTCEDSGERVWEPLREESNDKEMSYWATRRKVGDAKKAGEDVDWPDVYHIYGSYELTS